MIPYDVDASLHTESREPVLDDGFSPPAGEAAASSPAQPAGADLPPPVERWLREKSGF